jgi:hypothetical protein
MRKTAYRKLSLHRETVKRLEEPEPRQDAAIGYVCTRRGTSCPGAGSLDCC